MFAPAGRISSAGSDGNSRGGEKAAREHMLPSAKGERMAKMQTAFPDDYISAEIFLYNLAIKNPDHYST